MSVCNGVVRFGGGDELPCGVDGPLCDGCKEDRADARACLLVWAALPEHDVGHKNIPAVLDDFLDEVRGL